MAALTGKQAAEIAALLNNQNQLTVAYTSDSVLASRENYLITCSDEGHVIACAELKKVQWYQFELLHVTVAQNFHRKGHAKELVERAERIALERGARILQSTIRVGNVASENLFASASFNPVCRFYNRSSGNVIGVWQKVLAEPL